MMGDEQTADENLAGQLTFRRHDIVGLARYAQAEGMTEKSRER